MHTSIFADHFNTFMGKYSFRLLNCREERRIYICVYSLDDKSLLDHKVYYTYEDIEKALRDKLHNLFYVKSQRQHLEDGTESFYFYSAEIYTNPTLDRFLSMLDDGEIMYDIRMGAYGSGKNIGKPHDHGSGFRIKENNIAKLYLEKEEIN